MFKEHNVLYNVGVSKVRILSYLAGNHIQCIMYSNITSFFCFVDKRAIYQWYNVIRTCTGECDWLFHWQHKLCATFSASVNINYRLPIKVFYHICTLRHIRIEINHGSQNVLSFNMDWRILVNFIPRFWFGIKY
jgi:hypothetical protein